MNIIIMISSGATRNFSMGVLPKKNVNLMSKKPRHSYIYIIMPKFFFWGCILHSAYCILVHSNLSTPLHP